MANRKISELNEATQIVSTDIFPLVDIAASTTKKATFQKILDLVTSVLKPLSNPASAALDMANYKISNLAAPTSNNDAATKTYVDTGLSAKADATALSAKADTTYVDTQLGTKASTTDLAAKANLAANTFTGNQTGGDNVLVQWALKDYGLTFLDKGTTSGTATITFDYTAGSNQKLTIGASSANTFAISNWPPSGVLGQLLIELTNGNASGATITWPSINWILSDGTVTTSFASNGVTLQASGNDFILLWTRDGGTTVYGKVIR